MAVTKLTLSIGILALVVAGDKAAKFVNVLMPEPYTVPDAPASTAIFPVQGQMPCDYAIRSVMDISNGCLKHYDANDANAYYCQDPYGCRMSLTKAVHHMSITCARNTDQFATISNLFEQIAYHTSQACPTTAYSCDLQSSLVLSMQALWLNDTSSRAYECSPCVKQSFGRHEEVSGKSRCNKLGETYCQVDGEYQIARDNLCRPCIQRLWAKQKAVNDADNVEDNSAQFIRACYDDGDGNTCYSKVAAYLEEVQNVVLDPDGFFRQEGDFKACGHADACNDPNCMRAVQTLIDGVGCCAPAVPVHLLFNYGLRCLEPMIDQKVGLDVSCTPPATIFVDITVLADDSSENICKAVKQDLATTLAVLPHLIHCEGVDSDSDTKVTVRASLAGYRAWGTQSAIPFDPDVLQYPVLDIKTSAIA